MEYHSRKLTRGNSLEHLSTPPHPPARTRTPQASSSIDIDDLMPLKSVDVGLKLVQLRFHIVSSGLFRNCVRKEREPLVLTVHGLPVGLKPCQDFGPLFLRHLAEARIGRHRPSR